MVMRKFVIINSEVINMTDVKLGPLIKLYRKKLQLTQDELSIGICTTSYLSRIENDLVIPETQVLKLLLKRLGQEEQQLLTQYNEKIQTFEKIYSKLLDDQPLSNDDITIVKEEQNLLLATFQQLIYARYLMKENRLEEAALIIEPIIQTFKMEHNRLTELFISISTYYYLIVGDYSRILDLEQSLHLNQYFLSKHDYEQAIYYYHLSFAAHRDYQFSLALNYIEEASRRFTHKYRPLFELKLYSMYGVIYNALYRFDDSLKEYDAAIELLHLVPSIATNDQWASLLNNRAYCYECMTKYDLAIKYYEQSIHYKEDLHVIINYMRVLVLANRLEEVKELQKNYPISMFTITHHQNQWSLIYALANVEEISLETFQKMEEQAFKSIIKEKHIELIIRYSKAVAEVYSALHNYKKALLIYKKAFETSQELLSYGK